MINLYEFMSGVVIENLLKSHVHTNVNSNGSNCVTVLNSRARFHEKT